MTVQVKSYLAEMRLDTRDVQLWIRLLTPRLTAGDNMGVEIQQQVNDAVNDAEVSALYVLCYQHRK